MTMTTVYLPEDLAAKFKAFRTEATMNDDRILAMRQWLEVSEDRNDATGYEIKLPDSTRTKQVLFKIPEDLHARAHCVARKLRVSVATIYRFSIEFSVEVSEGLLARRA